MSDILSRVQILLDANTAKFEQNIKTADKTATSTFSNISSKAKVMGAAVAIASVTAVNGLVNFTNQQVQAINELERFAKLAETTPEKFQEMSVGAESVGINQEKLSDQMKDFNEKIGEFISLGSGGAADFFEQIATKTEGSAAGARKLALEIQRLSGPEGLQLMFDKMEQFGATDKQISFFLESMASDTTALIPLLRDGGKGFDEWALAAQNAGVVMDKDARAAAVELRSQTKLLELQYQGLKTQVAQAVIPAVLDLSVAFNQNAKDGYDVVSMADVLGNVLRGLGVIANTVSMSFKLTGNSFGGLLAAADAAQNDSNVPWYWKTTSGLLMGGWAKSKEATTIVSSMADDNAKIMEQYAKTNEILLNGQTDALSKYAKQAEEAKNRLGKNDFKGMDDWVAKTDKVKEAQDKLNKTLKEQQQLRDQINSEWSDANTQMNIEQNKALTDLSKAGFDNATFNSFKKKIEDYYFETAQLKQFQLEYDVNEFKLSEIQKLEWSTKIQEQQIRATKNFSDYEKELRINAAKEMYQYQLRDIQIANEEKLLNARQSIDKEVDLLNWRYELELAKIDQVRDAKLKNDLIDAKNIDHLRGGVALNGEYFSQERPQQYLSNQQQLDDDYIVKLSNLNTRYAQQQELFKNHHDKLSKIETEYYRTQSEMQSEYELKSQAAKQQDFENHMSLYSNMLSQAGSVWGSMTDLVKQSVGESSAAYKVMYFAQQQIAAAQATINAFLAYTNVLATAPYPLNLTLAPIALGLGMANVGMIEAQAIAGVFHGGTDYVPKESSYLLDEGERVLSPRQNQDLTNYLANQGGSGTGSGDVNIQVNVTDSGVNTSGASTENQKQLGQMIGNAVRAIIRQEQRQGRLLSK